LLDVDSVPIPGGAGDVDENGCITLITGHPTPTPTPTPTPAPTPRPPIPPPKYIVVTHPGSTRYVASKTEILSDCTRQQTFYINVVSAADHICCRGVSIPKHQHLTDANGTWDFVYRDAIGSWLVSYDVALRNGMPVLPPLCGIHCPGIAPVTVGYIGFCLSDGRFEVRQTWSEWFANAGYECVGGVWAYAPSATNCGGWRPPPFSSGFVARGTVALADAACDDFAITVPLAVDPDFGRPQLAAPGGLSVAIS
jgi:hypothetical protein